MKIWIKRLALGLGALLLALLMLVLAWVASNWRDAEPQPWPEALTPRAMSVADADNFFLALASAPRAAAQSPGLRLPDCNGVDCAAIWAKAAPQWAAQRQAHAALGAVCETGTRSDVPAYAEPLPATFSPNVALPPLQPLTGCSAWLLTQALEASAANQPEAAVAKLTQSARLSKAVLNGSQSLVGHMIAIAVWNRHLQALQAVAIQHPGTVPALQALPLPTGAQTAAAQRRWIAHEASYSRGVIRSLEAGDACNAEQGFGAWFCRASVALSLPNYSEQLFSSYWQQVLAAMRDDDPLSALESIEQRGAAATSGLFGSPWHWRGTVSHILFDVAHPQFKSYFVRNANLTLSAQATTLWLKARSEAAESRAAWLAMQVKGTPLADRLTIDSQGQWQLRALDGGASDKKSPTRWPAWPA